MLKPEVTNKVEKQKRRKTSESFKLKEPECGRSSKREKYCKMVTRKKCTKSKEERVIRREK